MDVLPELAHLQVVVSIAEAAQAVSCSHTDSWLAARLLLGWALVVAGGRRAVDESVDRAVVHELLLRAVRGAAGAGTEVGVADGDRAVIAFLVHGPADVLALNVG